MRLTRGERIAAALRWLAFATTGIGTGAAITATWPLTALGFILALGLTWTAEILEEAARRDTE